jgi:hypothetical protein
MATRLLRRADVVSRLHLQVAFPQYTSGDAGRNDTSTDEVDNPLGSAFAGESGSTW